MMAREHIGRGSARHRVSARRHSVAARIFLVSVFPCVAMLFAAFAPISLAQDDNDQVLTIDHFVSHVSTAPGAVGQTVQLYVRERVRAGLGLTSSSFQKNVVLFVHGATIPSEVGFDAQYKDYSWMAYLAQADLDVFAIDLTGYGPSTRPGPMDDPCNLAPAAQPVLVPSTLSNVCDSTYSGDITTPGSESDDIDAVVDYLRAIRHVDKINLVAWSKGGPRSGPYVATHPEKINSLILLAPTYMAGTPPEPKPATLMGLTTRQSFEAVWDNQLGCADQYDPAIRDSLWNQLISTDPTGATWGPGGYRAPTGGDLTPNSYWSPFAAKIEAPTLLFSGENDTVVLPENVRALYADLKTSHKVFAAIPCSSHYAAWETRHLAMFQASLEWLQDGSVNQIQNGTIRLGD